ncbi:MAG TPA: hypothetical protein VMH88_11420 [Gemmatimonadales bacterium]|nr:hypothetical protein [Gemmatimonadales bacterium]
MRPLLRVILLSTLAGVAGCTSNNPVYVPVTTIATPDSFGYQLEPSGDPNQPAGILLFWSAVTDPSLAGYRIYSRGSTTAAYGLRGETSSITFHDNGVPDLQYYVTAFDGSGNESAPSPAITVDERLQLQAPASLTSISLNGAIHLQWADNAYLADPARFWWYRVYSAPYDRNSGLCQLPWALEGTTVAPEFLASALPNGVPMCFGVSALSVEGYESLWSPLWQDTPRPDARNLLVYSLDQDSAAAGFRFWNDVNGDGVAQTSELGLVQSGNLSSIDFSVYRKPADSTLWIVPAFSGTSVQLYSANPIGDLTDIDFAPASGYSRNMLQAQIGYGYVFQIVEGATVRYAGLRVTALGPGYIIFDWSFQTDPGNPELLRAGGQSVALQSGSAVRK